VTERRLLGHAVVRPGEHVLEVGCGEGGNLRLLSVDRPGTVGVDLSRSKVRWASKTLGAGAFLCSDAVRLPFRDGAFDVVLCRDVLHHVRAKQDVVAELFRVCHPDGRVIVIEPNGRNPIMWLLGRVVPAERDLLDNSPDRVVGLVRQRDRYQANAVLAQPFPVGRVLFHYRLGFPRLSSWLSGAVLAIETVLERFIPRDRWAYIVVTASKGGSTASANSF
jgi:ubiquinone/menaquinone biosynthesis C-methylase UbiE